MSNFQTQNIAEIKKEFTTFLTNILTPLIYEGILHLYEYSKDCERKFIEASQKDPTVKNPGVLKLFQTCLREMITLSDSSKEREYARIKTASKCSEWFDNLVKAVIKSNINLLTNNSSTNIDPKYHETVNVKEFIHRCYIEASKLVYDNPALFYHDFSDLQIKKNQQDIMVIIRSSIEEAIRKSLPYSLILQEYLTHTSYIPSNTEFINMRQMLNKNVTNTGKNNSYVNFQPFDNLLEDEGDDSSSNDEDVDDNKVEELEDAEKALDKIQSKLTTVQTVSKNLKPSADSDSSNSKSASNNKINKSNNNSNNNSDNKVGYNYNDEEDDDDQVVGQVGGKVDNSSNSSSNNNNKVVHANVSTTPGQATTKKVAASKKEKKAETTTETTTKQVGQGKRGRPKKS